MKAGITSIKSLEKSKKQVILNAVTRLRNSEYGEGVTAIKVELEAQLNRNGDECDDNHECRDCSGNWEDATDCGYCSGLGYYRRQGSGDWENCNYDDYLVAEAEEGWEAVECDECSGSGTRSCEYCDEGYQECDGDCEDSEFSSPLYCHEWLMEKLSHIGLAEKHEDWFPLSHGEVTRWFPSGAMKYAEFYNDGSVDSEFTFTIMLNRRDNIFLLPKVIEIWNELGEAVGNGVGVSGAGMHMALLCAKNGKYPTQDWRGPVQGVRYTNFKKSMTMLLPALYCLGASTEESRGLSYRRPMIEIDSHRAAIDWRYGALEFRIFDTCYDNPEHILDNVVVIANCMKYWATKFVPSNVKIESTGWSDAGGSKLERFYYKVEHIELLNAGLAKLKPSYYTITEIKKQRNLTVTKRTIGAQLRQLRKQAEREYDEYVERFNWGLLARRHARMANMIESSSSKRPMKEIEDAVEEQIKEREKLRLELPAYVDQRVTEETRRREEYVLSVG